MWQTRWSWTNAVKKLHQLPCASVCCVCLAYCYRRGEKGKQKVLQVNAELSQKAKESNITKKELVLYLSCRHFWNLTCRSKSISLHHLLVVSCRVPCYSVCSSPASSSRWAVSITISRLKLLWTSMRIGLFHCLLIASWNQDNFHGLEMFWEGFISARYSIILLNVFFTSM